MKAAATYALADDPHLADLQPYPFEKLRTFHTWRESAVENGHPSTRR